MYGLIAKMTAQPGKRETLTAVLVEGVAGILGCFSYVIANDPLEAELIWITEVWESKEAYTASFSLARVSDAVTKARPLIVGMEAVAETFPVGGLGLGGGL